MTQAEVLARAGLLQEAAAEAEKAVDLSAERPHVKARAFCLLGDIAASGAKPDYRQAMQYHTQAVKLAEPLATSKHPAIRVAAKEVMLGRPPGRRATTSPGAPGGKRRRR